MALAIDQENIVRALKGEKLIHTCMSCKHYRKLLWATANCAKRLELTYHPITGKKTWMGETNSCELERGLGPAGIIVKPCGPDGVHWVKKETKRTIFFKKVKT